VKLGPGKWTEVAPSSGNCHIGKGHPLTLLWAFLIVQHAANLHPRAPCGNATSLSPVSSLATNILQALAEIVPQMGDAPPRSEPGPNAQQSHQFCLRVDIALHEDPLQM
jgi:hypothetical protein